MNHQVVIIGAGLSGLYAASLLTAQGIECTVLEARDRAGGRVLSICDSNQPELGKFDLGSTWFWPHYERTITNLVHELNIKTFDQYREGAMLSERSHNEAPDRYILPDDAATRSVRFIGGVQSLIDALVDTIPPNIIQLNTQVTAIQLDKAGNVLLDAKCPDGNSKRISATNVILALPPRIVAQHIDFTPSLPSSLITDLMNKPTWMAGQAKIIAVYDRPFWRELGLSGFVSSLVGPLQEIHDASPTSGSYALFGFLGIPATIRKQLGKEQIKELMIEQLVRLFGSSAKQVRTILYKDWAMDSETAVEEDLNPLRAFPNYDLPPNAGIWENSLFFAGTENSLQYGGHLEGALLAAKQAAIEITRK